MRLLHNSLEHGGLLPSLSFFKWRGLVHSVFDALESQSKQALLWCPVSLACGIGLYFALPFEPTFSSLVSVTGLLFSLYVFILRRGRYVLSMAFLLALCLPSLGLSVAKAGTIFYGTPLLYKELGPVSLSGQVEEIELLDRKNDVRLLLSGIYIEGIDRDDTPRKVRLRFKDAPKYLSAGQDVQVLAQLMPPSAPLIPGGFDFRRHFYFQGIGAVGFIYRMDGASPEFQDLAVRGDGKFLEHLRNAIALRVHASLPEDQANIIEALMIGRRAGINDGVYDDLRKAGLAHLLAISGLHIGLVAGALFFFVRLGLASSERLSLYRPIKKYAALFAIGGALIYMLLAGAPIPTQRAMIMTAIMFGAILIDRWPFSLRGVAVAAFVILLIAPHSLLSVSFQLSFAAVGALVAASEVLLRHWQGFKNKPGPFKRLILYVLGVAGTSLLAALATAPFALYHFQQLALLGVFANVVAIPLMAFIVMPAGIIAMLLMPLGLDWGPLFIMGAGVDWIIQTAHYFADISFSTVQIAQFSFTAFIFIVLSGLSLIIFSGHARLYCAGLFSCLTLLSFQLKNYDVLVSQDLSLIGFQAEKEPELVLSSLGREKFTADIWARALNASVNRNVTLFDVDAMLCGGDGCRIDYKGAKIAFPKSDYALAQDCLWADVVIADFYKEGPCGAPIAIDKRSLWRSGAVGVHIDSAGQVHASFAKAQAYRPWN